MLWLEGVVRYNIFDEDVGYAACRFRPVVERKTDISALKALLNTVPEKVLT